MNIRPLSQLLSTAFPSQHGRRRRAAVQAADVQLLEDRALLSAANPLDIAEVHLKVAGEDVVVKNRRPVIVQPGDSLEVVGITYAGSQNMEPLEGVIAFEGYLRTRQGNGKNEFDYGDGRFGDADTDDPIDGTETTHPGLDGDWDINTDTNRLVISMVRYFGNEFEVEDRFAINIQTGSPDFAHKLTSEPLPDVRLGKRVTLTGAWTNAGQGTLRTYAEVDIYHESDPETIVWVGVLEGRAKAGQQVVGRYVNRGINNALPVHWVPQEAGNYTLKFYGDPEEAATEANEDDNYHELELTVVESGGFAWLNTVQSKFGQTVTQDSVLDQLDDTVSQLKESYESYNAEAQTKIERVITSASKQITTIANNMGERQLTEGEFKTLDRLFGSLEKWLI